MQHVGTHLHSVASNSSSGKAAAAAVAAGGASPGGSGGGLEFSQYQAQTAEIAADGVAGLPAHLQPFPATHAIIDDDDDIMNGFSSDEEDNPSSSSKGGRVRSHMNSSEGDVNAHELAQDAFVGEWIVSVIGGASCPAFDDSNRSARPPQ